MKTQYINIKNNDIMKLRNTDYYHPTAQSRVQTMQEYSTKLISCDIEWLLGQLVVLYYKKPV